MTSSLPLALKHAVMLYSVTGNSTLSPLWYLAINFESHKRATALFFVYVWFQEKGRADLNRFSPGHFALRETEYSEMLIRLSPTGQKEQVSDSLSSSGSVLWKSLLAHGHSQVLCQKEGRKTETEKEGKPGPRGCETRGASAADYITLQLRVWS